MKNVTRRLSLATLAGRPEIRFAVGVAAGESAVHFMLVPDCWSVGAINNTITQE